MRLRDDLLRSEVAVVHDLIANRRRWRRIPFDCDLEGTPVFLTEAGKSLKQGAADGESSGDQSPP